MAEIQSVSKIKVAVRWQKSCVYNPMAKMRVANETSNRSGCESFKADELWPPGVVAPPADACDPVAAGCPDVVDGMEIVTGALPAREGDGDESPLGLLETVPAISGSVRPLSDWNTAGSLGSGTVSKLGVEVGMTNGGGGVFVGLGLGFGFAAGGGFGGEGGLGEGGGLGGG